MLLEIMLATILISLISFIGVFFLVFKKQRLETFLLYGVSLAIGGLLGGAFIHIIPEAIETISLMQTILFTALGAALFFLIEKAAWHHCHETGCKHKAFAYLDLIGDGIHNFTDGIIIAAAFLSSPHIGLITTIAVALHEIPQEIGDFAILVYGGFGEKKALFFNFISALAAVIGALAAYFVASAIESIIPYLLSIAAGGFIYMAAIDLIPELLKHKPKAKEFLFILLGIGLMALMLFLE